MAGLSIAVANGDELVKAVAALGRELGLEPMEQVRVARRIWGAERFIDVVQRIGVEPFKEQVYGKADQRSPRRQRNAAVA